jgi:hypothetical protein
MGTTFSVFAQLNRNNLVHYSEMDGTIIYDILDDRLGNIWLATQNGLTLFDGYEFKRFYPGTGEIRKWEAALPAATSCQTSMNQPSTEPDC